MSESEAHSSAVENESAAGIKPSASIAPPTTTQERSATANTGKAPAPNDPDLDSWTQAILNARPPLSVVDAFPAFAARAPIAAKVMDSDALQMLAAFDAPVLALSQVLRHELDYTRQVRGRLILLLTIPHNVILVCAR
jgi:hypothetical protein